MNVTSRNNSKNFIIHLLKKLIWNKRQKKHLNNVITISTVSGRVDGAQYGKKDKTIFTSRAEYRWGYRVWEMK